VTATRDGAEAWAALSTENAPSLAILDLMMPHLDGLEVCRKVRQQIAAGTYIILLTAKGRKEDVVAGLDAGADDYLVKPYDRDELRARVQAGVRMLDMQRTYRSACKSWRMHFQKFSNCKDCFPSAPTASQYATIKTTGSALTNTSWNIRKRVSVTAFARIVTSR
jgi:DNA-binding response OmpR family regulator